MLPDCTVSRKSEGFSGIFYRPDKQVQRAVIVLIGDEDRDRLNTACARWLVRDQNCAALCVGVHQNHRDDTGVHCWPMETVQSAIRWLNLQGYPKVGILGLSMQASLALTAASMFQELSLVIALSPNDFIPWGFHQGRMGKSLRAEWPSDTSAFTWQGKELPFQPAGLDPEKYWNLFLTLKKKHGEMHSKTIFDRSEQLHPIAPAAFIPVEKIRGTVILAGAEDDVMWDSIRYIRRIKDRLDTRDFSYPVHTLLYPYATHLLIPEAMLRYAIPLAPDWISRIYTSGRRHPKECLQARTDLDQKLTKLIRAW